MNDQKPYQTPLPPDEWQFWRIPLRERRAAAVYELARQYEIEHLKIKAESTPDKVWPPFTFDAARYWEEPRLWRYPYEPDTNRPWFGLEVAYKEHWIRTVEYCPLRPVNMPGAWKPQTMREWEKVEEWKNHLKDNDWENDPNGFPDTSYTIDGYSGPWFLSQVLGFPMKPPICHNEQEESSDADLPWWSNYQDYAPQQPSLDDPSGTIARRMIPVATRKGVKTTLEYLVAFALNADSSKAQLEEEFREWLEKNNLGSKHGDRGKKITDFEVTLRRIALRRLRLAVGEDTGVYFWEPLAEAPERVERAKWKFWRAKQRPYQIRKSCNRQIVALKKQIGIS